MIYEMAREIWRSFDHVTLFYISKVIEKKREKSNMYNLRTRLLIRRLSNDRHLRFDQFSDSLTPLPCNSIETDGRANYIVSPFNAINHWRSAKFA